MEVATFRIVQECLTNIHRHSGGKTATIRLSRGEKSVSLEIQDKGAGMSEEKLTAIRTQRSGVGITGMRERVRNLRGTMDIQSSAEGTTISVTFPVSTTSLQSSMLSDNRLGVPASSIQPGSHQTTNANLVR